MSYEDALKWLEWEETIILMIKNMVDKNLSLDDISSVTIDEIKKYI